MASECLMDVEGWGEEEIWTKGVSDGEKNKEGVGEWVMPWMS